MYNKICKNCNEKYQTKSRNKQYCEICAKLKRKERVKLYNKKNYIKIKSFKSKEKQKSAFEKYVLAPPNTGISNSLLKKSLLKAKKTALKNI